MAQIPEVILAHPCADAAPRAMSPGGWSPIPRVQPPGVMDPIPSAMLPHPQTDSTPRGDALPSPRPRRCHSGLAAGQELPQLPPGLPAGAGRDTSPSHPMPVPAPRAGSQQHQPLFLPDLGRMPVEQPADPGHGSCRNPRTAVGTPSPKGPWAFRGL